jgi:hypothetical protein
VTRVLREDWHSLDNLELELRKLPGVCAAGFDERDGMLLVQLHVRDDVDEAQQPLPVAAARIAARYSHRPAAVEVVRRRGMATSTALSSESEYAAIPLAEPEPAVVIRHDDAHARARLLAVLAFPETDELEVHLVHNGRRTIGRAPASHGLVGAVEATIDAIRELGAAFEPHPRWARSITDAGEDRTVVAVALEGELDGDALLDYGLAAGASPIDAAARSTLDALNRRLGQLL